jgi:hypothetical protein
MRAIALLLALTFAAACGSDATTEAAVTLDGNYSLQSVNGAALPYNLGTLSNGARLEVTNETLVIANGTYTATTTIRTTLNGTSTNETDQDKGTVSSSGSTVTFKSTTDASITTGTLSAGKLSITQEGITLVFVK